MSPAPFSVNNTPSISQHLCVGKKKRTGGEQKLIIMIYCENPLHMYMSVHSTSFQYRLRLQTKENKKISSAIPTSIAFYAYYLFNIYIMTAYVCRWFRFAQLAKGKKSRP
jgi:hypothetical protein